jgi:nitrite reductase (NADH) small subunit
MATVRGFFQAESGAAMGQFVGVARIGDLAEGESARVKAAGRDVALFLVGGQYFALADACPHMGASLAAGWVEDGIVTCPLHFWRFRLADGAWADNPRLKTQSYPVRIANDEIQVEVPGE